MSKKSRVEKSGLRKRYDDDGSFELIISFYPNRHHSLTISKGDTKHEIVAKLRRYANQIDDDRELS